MAIPQKYLYVLAPGMCEYRHYINTEGRGQSANTYFKKNSSKRFPVFTLMRIQAPHVFAQKLIPQELFLHVSVLCRGFVGESSGISLACTLSIFLKLYSTCEVRRRTNVQRLTCKMVWFVSFYSLLVSFRLFFIENSSKAP